MHHAHLKESSSQIRVRVLPAPLLTRGARGRRFGAGYGCTVIPAVVILVILGRAVERLFD